MPRPQFSIRTLLWITLVVAAFSTVFSAPPSARWFDVGKGAVIFVASSGEAMDLLKDRGRRNWKGCAAALVGYAAMSVIGLLVVISAFA